MKNYGYLLPSEVTYQQNIQSLGRRWRSVNKHCHLWPCLLYSELDGWPDLIGMTKKLFSRDLPEYAKSVINIPLPQPGSGWCCLHCQFLKELHVETEEPIAAHLPSAHGSFLYSWSIGTLQVALQLVLGKGRSCTSVSHLPEPLTVIYRNIGEEEGDIKAH